jgi:hypothetical protein
MNPMSNIAMAGKLLIDKNKGIKPRIDPPSHKAMAGKLLIDAKKWIQFASAAWPP